MLKLNPFQKQLLVGYTVAMVPCIALAMAGSRNVSPLAQFTIVILTLASFTFFFVKADK